MKPSPAQIVANLLNAQKSTGPRTEAGKNIARFNARRHGLTGQFHCMSQNDEQAYDAFEAKMLQSLQPVGAYENQLAISITQDQWRLNRSRSVEFNLYGLGHNRLAPDTEAPSPNSQTAATMADTYRDDDRVFGNIALYETRIHRIIARNKKDLDALQATRHAAEAKAREEAELLVKLADFMEDAEMLPTERPQSDIVHANGFVFSLTQLRAKLKRDHHLEIARECARKGWNRDRLAIEKVPDQPRAA